MMLFQKHLEISNWHTQHFSELRHSNIWMLGVEHPRPRRLNFFGFLLIDLTLNTQFHQFTSVFLVLHLRALVILPLIIHLFIDQPVRFLETLANRMINLSLIFHLHLNEFLHKFGLSF